MSSTPRPLPAERPSGRPRRAALVVLVSFLGLCADAFAQERGARRGRRAPITAICAGHVHPVSGPAIANGVVLCRGGRILAVGARDSIEIPDGAEVLEYPNGHVYPGLIDALSQAHVDAGAASAGGVDAGTNLSGALDPFHEPSRELVRHGITTAYVSNRTAGGWRGQGMLLRLLPDGPRPFGREDQPVGLHARLAASGNHPLQRLEQLAAAGKEFEQLKKYEEAFEKYDKDLEEFEKKYEEYLAWHRKRKPADESDDESKSGESKDGESDKGKDEKAEGEDKKDKPEQGTPAPGERRRGRRPGGGPRGGGGGERPAPKSGEGAGGEARPAGRPASGSGGQDGAKGGDDKGKDEKAPEKPKRPKEPQRDAAKDALIAVRDGDLRMFFEAVRPLEIRRALAVVREQELRDAVLENPRGAAAIADELAAAGVRAVLTDGRPVGEQSWLDAAAQRRSPAAALAAAGVPFAYGSGDLRRARLLPQIAAESVGHGVDADAAVRALTLSAAEVLGVEEQIGSLDAGKRADVLVVSAPLLSSDSRVLRVFAGGRSVHDAAASDGR